MSPEKFHDVDLLVSKLRDNKFKDKVKRLTEEVREIHNEIVVYVKGDGLNKENKRGGKTPAKSFKKVTSGRS